MELCDNDKEASADATAPDHRELVGAVGTVASERPQTADAHAHTRGAVNHRCSGPQHQVPRTPAEVWCRVDRRTAWQHVRVLARSGAEAGVVAGNPMALHLRKGSLPAAPPWQNLVVDSGFRDNNGRLAGCRHGWCCSGCWWFDPDTCASRCARHSHQLEPVAASGCSCNSDAPQPTSPPTSERNAVKNHSHSTVAGCEVMRAALRSMTHFCRVDVFVRIDGTAMAVHGIMHYSVPVAVAITGSLGPLWQARLLSRVGMDAPPSFSCCQFRVGGLLSVAPAVRWRRCWESGSHPLWG